MLEVVEAVDGAAAPYECREIRQQGRGALTPDDCRETCPLAHRMATAYEAYRQSLAGVSIGDILADLPSTAPDRTRSILTAAGRDRV
ncbi:hypothetical protein GCM10029964_046290 [Kibdelosporangium lantanae]